MLLTPTHPIGLIWADAGESIDGERWSLFQRVIRLANLGFAELANAAERNDLDQKMGPQDRTKSRD
jgi:elongation factor P--beta-lysine ligase